MVRCPGFSLAASCVMLVMWLSAAGCRAATPAGDWSAWRGPHQNGVSDETGLPATWSPDGANLVWKTQEVYGRNTPIVMDGRVFVFTGSGEGANERERLVCMDADTGKILWTQYENVYLSDIPSSRLGWPSPAGDPETGSVFVHFTGGALSAYDRDGKRIWTRSLTEEFNRVSGYGGRLMTPVVDGDLVIVSFLNSGWGSLAGGSHRTVAFDKRSGNVVWWSKPGGPPLDTTYSIPVVAEVNGTRLLICGVADGTVAAVKVGTGEPVWSYKFTKRGINVSPVVWKNRVYIAHSEESYDTTVMGRVVCIDATGTGDVSGTHEVWRVDGIDAGYASPAILDGRLYVITNSGQMHCLDAETGKEFWQFKIGRVAKGSPVLADGKMYLTEVNARFLILKPGDAGCELLDEEEFADPRFPAIDMFGSPAVANGRVYFLAAHGMYCIGSPRPQASATVKPLPPPEKAPADAKPAVLAVYPTDVLLRPGAAQTFTARAFDDKGRLIGEVKPEWSAAPPLGAAVDAFGTFKAAAAARAAVGEIKAKAAGLEAAARVRIVPELPIEEDFEKVEIGKAPVGWIGAFPRFVVEELDGRKVLKKPFDERFMRADAFIGSPDMTGYTIQADVAGRVKRRALPDIGLDAHRYRFEIRGTTQTARLVTWAPMPRLEQEMPFEWKADTWYTLKMRVDVAGEKVTVHGKVWPREQSEPGEWMLTLVDPIGQTHGAQGLYGFSMADLYFDNVRVWRND